MRHIRVVLILTQRQIRYLLRMPWTLAALFVPAIVLYAIFTLIFAGQTGGSGKAPSVELAFVDQDATDASRKLAEALRQMSVEIVRENADGAPLTVEDVRKLITSRKISVGIVVPPGYGAHPHPGDPAHPGVELIADDSQPAERMMIAGMLQMAAGRAMFDPTLSAAPDAATTQSADTDSGSPFAGGMIDIRESSVSPGPRRRTPASLMFLAGLVPMFLLFNATGAAGGLLAELQEGSIRRLLVAPVSPAHVLFAQMLFAVLLAVAQCATMYLFAWVAFGAPIWSHALGLLALTIATAAATVGFGMLLASVCRNLEQLNSFGTVVVLGMSAVGGSMIPRMFMPDWIKQIGFLTINGWAYDGFMDVITGRGISAVALELTVLLAVGVSLATVGSVLLRGRLRSTGVQTA